MPSRTKADYLHLMHSQLQSHYRTQKAIARSKKQARPGLNPFSVFLSVNVFAWIYHYLKSRVGKKHPFLDYSGSASNGVFDMVSDSSYGNGKIKIVLTADWATDTPESACIARLMHEENSDYSIHLGDIYFVGAPQEVYCNFLEPHAAWPKGKSGSLAIPAITNIIATAIPISTICFPIYSHTGHRAASPIARTPASSACKTRTGE